MNEFKHVAVFGAGYVGLSIGLLLARRCQVVFYDLNPERVADINKRQPYLIDKEIVAAFADCELDFKATDNLNKDRSNIDLAIICVPTDFDEEKHSFDTHNVVSTIKAVLAIDHEAIIVIKSTLPIGFTEKLRERFASLHIYFSPEFLREGKALYDNLHPSRIIVGGQDGPAKQFGRLLLSLSLDSKTPLLFMSSTEAETIKLFSNSYLAMRVAYFNEIDTFCSEKGIESAKVIKGVSLDQRVGDYYNNPSFGYGGYCLPKDTKHLEAEFGDIPESIISASINSNANRKNYIVSLVLKKRPKKVGIFGLAMKKDADNFRKSSVVDIGLILQKQGIVVMVYEPSLSIGDYQGMSIQNDLEVFKKEADVILANRYSSLLDDVKEKVISRDIYSRD